MACPNENPARQIDFAEFPTARAAVAHARTSGGRAIRMGGQHLVVGAADAEWLEAFGSAFAYLSEINGRLVSVPVNQ